MSLSQSSIARTRPSNLLVAGCLLLAMAVVPSLSEGAEGPRITLDPTGVRFEVEAEEGRWSLVVSGPERFHVRRQFEGVAPTLSLLSEGEALRDGSYVWELRRLDGKSEGVWSGAFHVRNGRTVATAGEESEPARARPNLGEMFTHTDDVTIDGKICVGSDCTPTSISPFGLFLGRANNTWLNFEDTSAAEFPSNDWRLRFNDSFAIGVGGTNYFGVEDTGDTGVGSVIPFRVDAGAPVDSLRVDQNGNVGLGTATPGATLEVVGDAIVDGDLAAGSSREIKRGFQPVDRRVVLERLAKLPLSEWSYLADDPSIRHLGPMAEDFQAAFGLGRDERYVSPVDLSGVAFAAIQGLHEVVREREAEIEALLASRDELAQRVAELERMMSSLAEPEAGLPGPDAR